MFSENEFEYDHLDNILIFLHTHTHKTKTKTKTKQTNQFDLKYWGRRGG